MVSSSGAIKGGRARISRGTPGAQSTIRNSAAMSRKATATIRERRAGLVAETPDWQELRHAGAAIKDDVLHHLDHYLEQFESNATARGAHVH